jgi:hypothetical protein
LNTQSFIEKEVKMMSTELSNKFNLNTNVRLNKNKNVIIITSESYKIFKDLIDPYIIPSMRYKLHT